MYYNPYETDKAKQRRRLSNFLILLVIVMFIVGILAIIFRKPTIIKNEFEQVSGLKHTFSENDSGTNEFRLLYGKLKDNSTEKNDAFEKAYPTAAALLSLDKSIYNSEKPLVLDRGGYLTVAQVYNAERADIRVIDVILFQYFGTVLSDENGVHRVVLNISAPIRYSVNYNTRDGSVSFSAYSDTSYRLDTTSLTTKFNGKDQSVKAISYALQLNKLLNIEAVKKRDLEQAVMDEQNSLIPHSEILTEGGKAVIKASQDASAYTASNGNAAYRLLLDKNMYQYFSGMEIVIDFSGVKSVNNITYQLFAN